MKTRILNPLNRKWEFETNAGYLADIFLQILQMFEVVPYETYIPSYLDYSLITFRTTKTKKDQIYYVFRRYVSDNLLTDVVGSTWNIGEVQKGGDWYSIY